MLTSDKACELVCRLVCLRSPASIEDLRSQSREAEIAHRRQMAQYLLHITLEIPTADIAEYFNREGSVPRYSYGAIEDKRDDPKLDAELEEYEALLNIIGPLGGVHWK